MQLVAVTLAHQVLHFLFIMSNEKQNFELLFFQNIVLYEHLTAFMCALRHRFTQSGKVQQVGH